MKRRTVTKIAGAVWFLNAIWAALDWLVSVLNFPEDARSAVKVLTDAPRILPVSICAISLLAIAWAIFWPEREKTPSDPTHATDNKIPEWGAALSGQDVDASNSHIAGFTNGVQIDATRRVTLDNLTVLGPGAFGGPRAGVGIDLGGTSRRNQGSPDQAPNSGPSSSG